MRTFVAIDLSEEIKKNLILLLNQLDTGSRSVKWVKRQAMHVTLKFLGEISEIKADEVKSALERTASIHHSFPLTVKGTGTFPQGKKSPRVIWTGISENDSLSNLQSSIEDELEQLGFPKEKRKFIPHLTLGRVKATFDLPSILSVLARYKDTEFGFMEVKKITFFRSILKPTGAEYSILSEFALQ